MKLKPKLQFIFDNIEDYPQLDILFEIPKTKVEDSSINIIKKNYKRNKKDVTGKLF